MLIQNKTIEEWLQKIVTKLREANIETVRGVGSLNRVILEIDLYKKVDSFKNVDEKVDYIYKMRDRVKHILGLHDAFHSVSYGTDSIATLEITIDENTNPIITDQDRLNNKIFKVNKQSPYDTHATRFVRTFQDYNDGQMTLEEYDELCRSANYGLKLKTIYKLNGSVQVAAMVLKGIQIYAIFGSTANNPACFKTVLPDLEDPDTLFPVPDRLLHQNIDRLTFTKMVRETLVEKDKQFKELLIEYMEVSDKDLFLNTPSLGRLEKIFIKKYRNGLKFELIDAFKFVINECSKNHKIDNNDRTTDLQED